MIGSLAIPGWPVATLNDEGVWECEDEILALKLNNDYSPEDVGGVAAVLPFGEHALSLAAEELGGVATHANPPAELPPDVIS